ncbi:glycosyltransferase family 4 protein [Niastella sp. OAS944]|uniref:glycosyltransferase family 4 protein n=1 Tax=Niastella sp. OAS944 TaxID=2664089 RepID=UPI00346B5610|nr:glycosyltransferase involved in cell wall biosynthesis [Chitinophagaceae bacterium OAS944]
MHRILFISHNATLTGAPMVLLNLLKWLKQNTDTETILLVNEAGYDGGALLGKFSEVAETYVVERMTDHELYNFIANKKIDLIFSNTIVNIHLLNKLFNVLQVPHVCFVHELETVIKECKGLKENMEWIDENTDMFLACSKAVKENLVVNNGIEAEKINVIQEFIEIKKHDPQVINSQTAQIRSKLNIPNDTLVLGVVGATQYRKGFDLLVPIANSLKSKNLSFKILVVGADATTDAVMYDRVSTDIKKAGLKEHVYLIPPDLDIDKYYNLFDIFLMLSREDPFPLVNLHAASFGSPIICFNKSGGSPDFVENDCGFVVDYLNIEQLAEKVCLLASDPQLRKQLGQTAKTKVESRNDMQVLSPVVNKLLIETIQKSIAIDFNERKLEFKNEIADKGGKSLKNYLKKIIKSI